MKINNLVEQDALIKSLEGITYLMDENYNFINIWTSDQSKLIIPKADFLGKNLIEVFGEEFGRQFCDLIDKTIQTQTNQEIIYKRPYGTSAGKWHKTKFNYIFQDESKKEQELISMVVKDINNEKLVSDKHDLFESIIANNWDAIVFANMDGVVEYTNDAANKLYGYKKGELIGKNVDIFNSHLSHNTDEIVEEITAKGRWDGELIQRKKDNSTFDALLSVQLIMNNKGVPIGFFSYSKNITEDKETAKKLKRIIGEKEILLKELHHRVKNNLSIIKGMLNLQKAQSENEIEINLIDDFQNRVNAIATLHSSLFDSKELDNVEFGPFMKELCQNLADTFFSLDKKIKLNISYDTFTTPFSAAIPLGLIINEVMTNAFKHAFNIDKGGEINVSLVNNEKETLIRIEDNGGGFDFDTKKDSSLGISLIEGLVDQIDGTFEYKNENGSVFELKLQSLYK